MRFKWGVFGLKIKGIRLIAYMVGGKVVSIDSPTIRFAIDSLNLIEGNIKLVHIVVSYSNGEKKTANCDSLQKAISWLNLNDAKENE